MKITYYLTVVDELKEFERLLSSLPDDSDLVVQIDCSKDKSSDILAIMSDSKFYDAIIVLGEFDGDFAKFKNNALEYIKGDYVLQLDADEYMNIGALNALMSILESNDDIDAFMLPRENYVHDITDEYITSQDWVIDEKGRINYPDYQMRLFKNNKGIKWEGKVHERLVGYNRYSALPCPIIHIKDFERQVRQNNLYASL
jgi:glycosyltransferase involved in cell wall biosynthesis